MTNLYLLNYYYYYYLTRTHLKRIVCACMYICIITIKTTRDGKLNASQRCCYFSLSLSASHTLRARALSYRFTLRKRQSLFFFLFIFISTRSAGARFSRYILHSTRFYVYVMRSSRAASQSAAVSRARARGRERVPRGTLKFCIVFFFFLYIGIRIFCARAFIYINHFLSRVQDVRTPFYNRAQQKKNEIPFFTQAARATKGAFIFSAPPHN